MVHDHSNLKEGKTQYRRKPNTIDPSGCTAILPSLPLNKNTKKIFHTLMTSMTEINFDGPLIGHNYFDCSKIFENEIGKIRTRENPHLKKETNSTFDFIFQRKIF
jgi:hypothetical protein